ncbi:MAG: hypothetical protein LBT79_03405 [Elusimicrobiota bacterium]|jgi:biotin carboxyl carrier protein|nr:hypothetical protein [Elusimicrobiota bacterium]
METQDIKKFLKSIRETDIEELKYQSGGDSIYFKKDCQAIVSKKNNVPQKSVKEVQPRINKEQEKTLQKPPFLSLKSIMVGTFSEVLGEDGIPLIKEGSKILKGQKVGQIEAMKIIKDIVSDIEGIVIKILISNGAAVEYGQELFLIDTDNNAPQKTGENSVQ